MMEKLWTKVGIVLISGFMLGSGLLGAQPVQAHSVINPSCSGLPTVANFFTDDETANLSLNNDALTGNTPAPTPKKGTGASGEGNKNFYYAKITVPALTAGELTVSDATPIIITYSSEAILCGRQEGSVSSQPSYASAHTTADNAADAAIRAQTAAAAALRTAAHALSAHMGFSISALISSGDEEYVVVISVPTSATATLTLTIGFEGVMSTTANAPAGGSFTTNNQRDPHILRATAPGLLTVHTTGSRVRTKGTLNDGTTDIAMDEGSGGNFKIISPMDNDVNYTVSVEGQTRSERGDYGLKIEFGVATELVSGGNYADTTLGDAIDGSEDERVTLEPGRADYFFFAVTDYRFLTVQTQKHADVTTETNTTGALFSQDGLVVTDTNRGTGNNFLFRVPVAPGDYIVEVKGASTSTKGKYVLATTSTAAPSQGSAPDNIMETSGTNIATAAAKNPHSITVTKAGTLQVKTTGTVIDTVGVLYGPDGRQIATDDNSGADKNFLLTEYVKAGQYIVTVEGQSRSATGVYTLVVNFVEGADIDITTPTTPGGDGTDLQAEVTRLRNELDACLMPVVADTRGAVLENPSGSSENPGYRSGIGVISGWVCAANEVKVEIRRAPTSVLVDTLTVAYGTSRPDVPENSNCDNENAGFGMTYNFNHLQKGEYTITAYADDGERIGETQTFEVVPLVNFERDDLTPFDTDADDRFLRNLEDLEGRRGTCIVDDFPTPGQGVWLKWEQSTQNFVIEDAG